mgnify:CR=1 FL=1
MIVGIAGSCGRSIPTGVGNTERWCQGSRAGPVHPHGRGEYSCGGASSTANFGPSPRAWGIRCSRRSCTQSSRSIPTGVGNTLHIGSVLARYWRSIPTGVGNTPRASFQPAHVPVHPHGRGEYAGRGRSCRTLLGPSPRAWGIPVRGEAPADRARSIPTGVGNTWDALGLYGKVPVHPHGRGEYPATSVSGGAVNGPSPRAWGIHMNDEGVENMGRSIPTGVGNTWWAWMVACRFPVHPHGRGEYAARVNRAPVARGPSPRAWGIRCRDVGGNPIQRSIPTGVGNTRRRSRSSRGPPVHPHGRGEYLPHHHRRHLPAGPSPRAWGIRKFLTITTAALGGPSPRAWGIPRGGRWVCTCPRSIPTGVGNTVPPATGP